MAVSSSRRSAGSPRRSDGTSRRATRRNQHFGRPIEPDCLYCHANRFEAVAGTINGYRRPIFHGLSIGCERCHGPGGLHVRSPGPADGPGGDRTIVNPRRPRAGLARGGLRAVPPAGGLSHRAGRAPRHRFPPRPPARILPGGVRPGVAARRRDRRRRSRRADARQPVLQRRRGAARLRLMPRPAPEARAGAGRRLLSGSLSRVSRRSGLRTALRPASGSHPRR